MTILSDRDIRKYVQSGEIKIDPEPDWDKALGAASVDFRLGNTLKVFNLGHDYLLFDQQVQDIETFICPEVSDYFILGPGDFVLGQTMERIELPDFLRARLIGRSRLARWGLMVNATSDAFAPGFQGTPVLELKNIGYYLLKLVVGERVCSFEFETLSTPCDKPYNGRYQGQ